MWLNAPLLQGMVVAEEEPKLAAPSANTDKLTQSEKDRIAAWYDKVAPQGAECPICKSKNWAALDHFVVPTAVSGAKRTDLVLGGPAYVHFMLACQTCGNVQFINAFKSGVLPSPEAEDDK